MEKRKLNVGILGCGNISASHIPAVLANSDLVNLYALCDEDPEKLNACKEKYQAEKYYSNYLDMLKDPDVDIVNICTPSGVHGEQVENCAKYGKHVLCEKPLEITSEKLDSLINAYSNTDLKAGAVFQYRTYAGIQKAKSMIDNGELGRLLVGNSHYKMYRSPEYYKSAGWRGTWAMDGGGSTMNQGIHILDILCYLGGNIKSVFAKAPTLARDIEVEDALAATLTFENSAIGNYQSTTLAMPPIEIKAELIFEKGVITFVDPDVYLFTEENPKGILLGEATNEGASGALAPTSISIAGHSYLVRNLANAVLGNEEVFVPLSDGRHVVDVILAMYESDRTGKEVTIREAHK